MSDRWEERKEQLATFRAEYSLLFPDLHFFQGLRFAVLGATLPLMAGLFSYYRSALPFKDGLIKSSPTTFGDAYVALLMAAIAIVLVLAVYSVDLGIRNQTYTLIARGVELEKILGIQNGAFSSLQNRVRSVLEIIRISGIITFGFFLGFLSSVFFITRALLNIF